MSYRDFFNDIQIAWLTQNKVGKAFFQAWADLLDIQADNFKQATKASFPDNAPTDAINYLADDFGEIQGVFGPNPETNDNFRQRLKNAWSLWQYAGSPLGLLLALYFLGYSNRVKLIQQNGIVWQLNSDTIANNLTDYTSFIANDRTDTFLLLNETIDLIVTISGTLVAGDVYLFETTDSGAAELIEHSGTGTDNAFDLSSSTFVTRHSIIVTVTDDVTPTYDIIIDFGPTIHASGASYNHQLQTPWWSYDARTDLTNRYSIVFTENPGWWANINNPPSNNSIPSDTEINLILKAADLYGPAKARCINLILIDQGTATQIEGQTGTTIISGGGGFGTPVGGGFGGGGH